MNDELFIGSFDEEIAVELLWEINRVLNCGCCFELGYYCFMCQVVDRHLAGESVDELRKELIARGKIHG